MSAQLLQIGSTDWSWILLEKSIKWSRNDLDSDDAGRTLDGVMHRARVAIKRKIEVQDCKRLTIAQMAQLNSDLMPETVTLKFLDAITGEIYTGEFYGSSVSAALLTYDEDNDTGYWEDYSFSLTEV